VHGTDESLDIDSDLFSLLYRQEGETVRDDVIPEAQSELEAHPEASLTRALDRLRQTAPRSDKDSGHIFNEVLVDEDLSVCQSERQDTAPSPLRPSTTVSPTGSAAKRTKRNQRPNVQRSPSKNETRRATIQSSQRKVALLKKYVDNERHRCQISGLPYPELPFNWAIEQNSGMQKYETELKTLFSAIASPESLAQLQDIIRAYWRGTASNSLKAGSNLSNEQRLELIEHLEGDSAHIGLVKDVTSISCSLKIAERIGPAMASSSVLHKVPREQLAEKVAIPSGNPSHRAAAIISTLYMEAICPGLQYGSPNMLESTGYSRRCVELVKLWIRLLRSLVMVLLACCR